MNAINNLQCVCLQIKKNAQWAIAINFPQNLSFYICVQTTLVVQEMCRENTKATYKLHGRSFGHLSYEEENGESAENWETVRQEETFIRN